PKAPADFWRLGNRGAAQLGRCLHAAAERLPEGSVTALAAPGLDDAQYRFAWATYLLPERRLVVRTDVADDAGVDFVFSLGQGLNGPRLVPLFDTACGTLYSVRPAVGGVPR